MDIEHGSGSEHRRDFVDKVAEKLGVSPEKVTAALRDVRKERIDQVITERIQEAVQNGIITQVEAGRIREWWKNRPDGLQKLLGNMRGHWGEMRAFKSDQA